MKWSSFRRQPRFNVALRTHKCGGLSSRYCHGNGQTRHGLFHHPGRTNYGNNKSPHCGDASHSSNLVTCK